MSQLVERTAKTPFKLGGTLVSVGQVVVLNPVQLGMLSRAGCVEGDATANASVPRQDLPQLRREVPAAIDPGQIALADASEAIIAHLLGRKLGLSPDGWRGLSVEEQVRALQEARVEIEASARNAATGIATDTEEGRQADLAVRQHAGNDPAAASSAEAAERSDTAAEGKDGKVTDAAKPPADAASGTRTTRGR